MISLDFILGTLTIGENEIFYRNEYDMEIYKMINYQENVYLSFYHKINKEAVIVDTIYKFDNQGVFVYKTGLLTVEYPLNSGEQETWEASNMSIVNNQLYLGYSKGYEAWFDIETGKLIKAQPENRR